MSRSLKVDKQRLEQVKLALLRNGFPSQKALSLNLGLALSTVSRFFTGKTVDYSTFVDICEELNLEWKDIADINPKIASKDVVSSNNSPTLPIPENLEFPEGIVPPDSPFYQTRENIESICYQTIIKPASLIRIKAPQLMGKTSLIMKILDYARSQEYKTVYLDINTIERDILNNLDKFLRYLCVMVGKELKLENQVNDYWDLEILGSNGNCTAYFEEYLLTEIQCPVILALDGVDRLFSVTSIIEDFFGMLRSWHEKGKVSRIWQNLHLIVAHSTEVYISLDINQSPFNAGVPIELLELNSKEIENLAILHKLSWKEKDVKKIVNLLGGHPYLIRLAMYHLSLNKVNLEVLLEDASKENGVYSNHLRGHLDILQKKPSLAKSFKQVVFSEKPVELNPMEIYQLNSMGLVKLKDNQVIPRCKLYRDYFQRVLCI